VRRCTHRSAPITNNPGGEIGRAPRWDALAIVHHSTSIRLRGCEFPRRRPKLPGCCTPAPTWKTPVVRLVGLDLGVPSTMQRRVRRPGSSHWNRRLDELSSALGMDPIELRLRKLCGDGSRERQNPGPARRSASATRQAQSASAGRGAILRDAPCVMVAGWSAWAWRPRPTRVSAPQPRRSGHAAPTTRGSVEIRSLALTAALPERSRRQGPARGGLAREVSWPSATVPACANYSPASFLLPCSPSPPCVLPGAETEAVDDETLYVQVADGLRPYAAAVLALWAPRCSSVIIECHCPPGGRAGSCVGSSLGHPGLGL